MAKKSLSDLSFDFDEDGTLALEGFEEGDVFEEDEIYGEDEEEVVEEEEAVEDDGDETPDLRTEVESLKQTIHQLPQMIAASIAAAMKGAKTVEDEEEEIPDELTGKQMVNIIGKRMEKAIKAEVGNAVKEEIEKSPTTREAKINAEFASAYRKYGEPFKARLIPVAQLMQRVEKSGGRITAEDAYLSIKHIPVAPTKTQQGEKITTKKRSIRPDADSDDSIGGELPARPKYDIKKYKQMSDTEVFQHSWNQALLKNTRRRAS